MLEGKVAVVTGGGNGIGRTVAIGLAAAGAKVVVNDLGVQVDGADPSSAPSEEVVRVIREAGGEALASNEDVCRMSGGAAVIEQALDAWGRIDSVSCCAGILRPSTIFDMSEADWDSVLAVNLKGHFATIQPAVIAMRRQGSGTIMTYTSSGGLEGSPNQPNYSAAKEGIIGLTRSVALSIAPYATCNAISPSVPTRMTRRMGRVDDRGAGDVVAPLAVFLSSEHARSITGQVIAVGGDRISIYPQPTYLRSSFREGGWSAEVLAERWAATLGQERLLRYDRFVGKPA